MAVIN